MDGLLSETNDMNEDTHATDEYNVKKAELCLIFFTDHVDGRYIASKTDVDKRRRSTAAEIIHQFPTFADIHRW
jgi:hypothetical protein